MTANINELGVYHSNNYTVTTSHQVATNFEKRHDNVLRDIDNLKEIVPNFGEMFFQTEMLDSRGKMRRIYVLTRDGFTLLAMGFSGKNAMQFKLAYLNEFNRMEEALKSPKVYSFEIEDPEERALAFIEETKAHKKQLAERDSRIEEQQEYIENQQLYIVDVQPKVEVYDRIMESDNTYAVSVIASDYGLTAQKFNNLLNEQGIQYKRGVWVLYAPYQGNDYTRNALTIDGHTSVTKWTEKGREFLYNTLKENGILPIAERDPRLLKHQATIQTQDNDYIN